MAIGSGTLESMGLNADFWKGRRVWLSGHTGFKGGWLSVWLSRMGATVHGYALPPTTAPNLFEAAKVEQLVTHTVGDIRDEQGVLTSLTGARPEIVIHMAAQPLVRYGYENPLETYQTNVIGTANVLQAVRAVEGVRAVVVVTTDKCYLNREWHWGYREDEALGGFDPYSSSKACAELVAAAYRQSYFHADKYAQHGVAVATARAGNVIGGGDWADDRLIPDMMRAIATRQPLRVRNPDAVRPWQHVLEPLRGYLMLAEKLFFHGPQFEGAWNFGPSDDDAQTVRWIAERLVNGWGNGASWSEDNLQHPHEAKYLKLDSSSAKARLGWHPRWRLERALGEIVTWYRAHLSGANMYEITSSQIAAFADTNDAN